MSIRLVNSVGWNRLHGIELNRNRVLIGFLLLVLWTSAVWAAPEKLELWESGPPPDIVGIVNYHV